MNLIDYKDVEIRQGAQTVLQGVNLSIGTGELVYLLGPIGSGKSTFLKTLYGEVPIYSGEAHFMDYNLKKLKRRQIPYLRRKIGIVFQDFQLLPDRSVEENLLFVLKATGWRNKSTMKKQVEDVLREVGMVDKMYKMPYHLSGGEQQRVVIARALLNSPRVVLADEPTGNLDAETGHDIMQLLDQIRQAGITVVLSTHNRQWPVDFPGRNLRLGGGRISEGE